MIAEQYLNRNPVCKVTTVGAAQMLPTCMVSDAKSHLQGANALAQKQTKSIAKITPNCAGHHQQERNSLHSVPSESRSPQQRRVRRRRAEPEVAERERPRARVGMC